MMDGFWRAVGSRADNWGPSDVTGTLRGMMRENGDARTLRGNMGDVRGVDCAQQRNISERLAKVAACSDWTVANGVAGLGYC